LKLSKLFIRKLKASEVSAGKHENMLEAINLSKTYTSEGTDYEVLKNVNLQIQQGECVAIIGKSGSGKSTLMHLLACLDAPTTGTVTFESADLSLLNEKEKDTLRNEKFGFVFQQFFLNGHETVFENVVLPLRIRGAENYDIVKNAMIALEAVGLKDKETKKAKDLSGGEKQRVCIARALVSEPQIIFADEPTGNLDSNTSAIIEDMLFRLNREKNITLIVVTHDDDLAAKCQRIIELKDGQIVSERNKSVIAQDSRVFTF
jgi:putative ABC transport system ATP-binding protein